MFEKSKEEYDNLPESEWVGQWFCETSGGYVAAHRFKTVDDLNRPGIVAEIKGCRALAVLGKHVLRLPENVANLIDTIVIDGKSYSDLLKFKQGAIRPRGYPDAYFDGQTWDFKTSAYQNIESVRQLFKDGRKADNVIFVANCVKDIKTIRIAVERETGRQRNNGTWGELPDVYCLFESELKAIWIK